MGAGCTRKNIADTIAKDMYKQTCGDLKKEKENQHIIFDAPTEGYSHVWTKKGIRKLLNPDDWDNEYKVE